MKPEKEPRGKEPEKAPYSFRVAENAGDYRACQALAREEGVEVHRLSFPTVMVMQGKKLVAFVGTATRKGLIVAGPLVVRSDERRPFAMLRLAEQYETVMRNLGISSFIMSAAPGSTMHQAIERYTDMQPYAHEDGEDWYIRRL